METKIKKGTLLGILAATLWGVGGTLGQFLFQQKGINVEWLITVRLLISGIGLLIIAKATKNNIFLIWNNKKDVIQLLIFSIIGMLGVQYTYFAAIKHSNAATATVLQFAGPILIAIYLALKHKRFPKKIEFMAILLAVIGTFLLVTHGRIDTLSISETALFFGIASAITLAIYTLQPKDLLSKYNSAVVVGWGMLLGGIAFSFVKAPWSIEGEWDIYTFSTVAFIIIFGTLIAFYSYLNAVKLIGGQKTSLLASAEPLVAVILSVIWLKTPFAPVDWIGSICIISTVFLLTRKISK
ncbi:threonine/homoserine efflux transporter RhtA [Flavobacterium sp. 90]|uniref:DMT family transporter n=1 Tax=unclassified Flavobacterium TaxID=196869 RepID=UPI000EAEBA8A|nr:MULTISPECIES: EamA family transporter [unclassified Flavobacterium]RKR05086.1 threonine/homoserine efflux transporter RhtA [Flavobacterium sp. 81]TCK56402.1 threonine/homoserine efflux transporter RhtA [Flavobacterium sp. 90]